MIGFLPNLVASENSQCMFAIQWLFIYQLVKRLHGSKPGVPQSVLAVALLANLTTCWSALEATLDSFRARDVFIRAFKASNVETHALTAPQPCTSRCREPRRVSCVFLSCCCPSVRRRIASIVPLYPLISAGVRCQRGIVFHRVGGKDLKVDVYTRAGLPSSGKAPCFMCVTLSV